MVSGCAIPFHRPHSRLRNKYTRQRCSTLAAGEVSRLARAIRSYPPNPGSRSAFARRIVFRYWWRMRKPGSWPVSTAGGGERHQISWEPRLTCCGHAARSRKTSMWQSARRLGRVATRWVPKSRRILKRGGRKPIVSKNRHWICLASMSPSYGRRVSGKYGSPENALFANPRDFFLSAGKRSAQAECSLL